MWKKTVLKHLKYSVLILSTNFEISILVYIHVAYNLVSGGCFFFLFINYILCVYARVVRPFRVANLNGDCQSKIYYRSWSHSLFVAFWGAANSERRPTITIIAHNFLVQAIIEEGPLGARPRTRPEQPRSVLKAPSGWSCPIHPPPKLS